MSKLPRPTDLTREERERIQIEYCEALVENRGVSSAAADAVGISIGVLKSWRRHPAFKEMELEANLRVDDALRAIVNDEIFEKRDPQMLKIAMRTRLDEYKDKREVEVKGKVEHEHVAKISDEDRALLVREANKSLEAPIDADYEDVTDQ
jgi:hypothetical protein